MAVFAPMPSARSGLLAREIADELNRQGYTTRRGTAWRFQYVAAALKAAA
jgi:hypothetical protein